MPYRLRAEFMVLEAIIFEDAKRLKNFFSMDSDFFLKILTSTSLSQQVSGHLQQGLISVGRYGLLT